MSNKIEGISALKGTEKTMHSKTFRSRLSIVSKNELNAKTSLGIDGSIQREALTATYENEAANTFFLRERNRAAF